MLKHGPPSAAEVGTRIRDSAKLEVGGKKLELWEGGCEDVDAIV
jgi:hypothetical protein